MNNLTGRSIYKDIKDAVSSGDPVNVIIFINVCVFLLINLFKLIDGIAANGEIYFTLMEQLLLRDDLYNFLTHPWTLFTHMFAHEGLIHIVFNMLYLYWFGRIVRDYSSYKHIWPLYILGGLSGALFLLLVYNIFPGLQSSIPVVKALGASAAVNAIVIGAATLVPNLNLRLAIFGDVKLKWIAAVVVLINFLGLRGNNPIGALGHLGGALFGFIYIRQLLIGNNISEPFYSVVYFFRRIFQKIIPSKRPQVIYKKPEAKRGDHKAYKPTEDKQARIDAILDKISQSGYDSLTKDEKAFLFRNSNED